MIFRQLFDPFSSTYTYLLGCEISGEAILIDPVFEQYNRDAALIRELSLQLRYVLDTHVHADHITSAWLCRENLGAQIVLSGAFGAEEVDLPVSDEDQIRFGTECVAVMATPGHTGGCVTYVQLDRRRAFTGDCLLIRGSGRTDFQSGDVHLMWSSIRDRLFSLPDSCQLYPGHDYQGRTVTTVAEERQYNPRIGGDAQEEDFAGYMANLGLPHPKLIDIAVPANMKSGRPDDGVLPAQADWGPIVETFAGVPEVLPEWVASHMDEVFILDVRESTEMTRELGILRGACLIPLSQLRERLAEVPRDRPVVAVCQSGKRSAMATQILRDADYDEVANIPGGLIHWMRMALPYREV